METSGRNHDDSVARIVTAGDGTPSTDVIATIRQYSRYYPVDANAAIEELIRRFESAQRMVSYAMGVDCDDDDDESEMSIWYHNDWPKSKR